MIEPAYLTETQWFKLCHRIYRLLRLGDPKLAFQELKNAGFDDLTKTPE